MPIPARTGLCLLFLAVALPGCSAAPAEAGRAPQTPTGGSPGDAPDGSAGGGGAAGEAPADPCADPIDWNLPAETAIHACSTLEGKRCLPEEALRRRAIAYSGYRSGQDPRVSVYPTEAEIREDLELLESGGWTLLRLFDSGTHAERTLKVIDDNELDMKVQLGVWISGPKQTQDSANQAEIEKGIWLANTYPDTVIAVSVGNETLDDWSSVRTPPADLTEYILQVRSAIAQPVTTDDMYIPFKMEGIYADVDQVLNSVDFLSVHVYAFIDAQWSWNWKQTRIPEGPERARAMMEAGLQYTKAAFNSVRTALDRKGIDLPLTIGEAGWKTRPTKPDAAAGEGYRAHPVNQKIFYRELMRWVYGDLRDETSPSAAFYFEAFDEPWKGQDDGWGLFDVERKAKHVVACDFPDRALEDALTYVPEDAVYFSEAPVAP